MSFTPYTFTPINIIWKHFQDHEKRKGGKNLKRRNMAFLRTVTSLNVYPSSLFSCHWSGLQSHAKPKLYHCFMRWWVYVLSGGSSLRRMWKREEKGGPSLMWPPCPCTHSLNSGVPCFKALLCWTWTPPLWIRLYVSRTCSHTVLEKRWWVLCSCC